jgi:AhpD family alkylhydroperoxidase
MEQSQMGSKLIDHKLKGRAELRVATLVGCRFCMDIGSAAARAHGIAAEQIANLNNYRSDFNFSDLERLVLEYADGMTRTPVDVSDALFTRLREKFTEAELVELSPRSHGKATAPASITPSESKQKISALFAQQGCRSPQGVEAGGLYEKRSSVRTAGMIRPVGNR